MNELVFERLMQQLHRLSGDLSRKGVETVHDVREDCLQAARLAFFRASARAPKGGTGEAYVYRAMKNAMIDVLRTERRHSHAPIESVTDHRICSDRGECESAIIDGLLGKMFVESVPANLKPYAEVMIGDDTRSVTSLARSLGINRFTAYRHRNKAAGLAFVYLHNEIVGKEPEVEEAVYQDATKKGRRSGGGVC